MSSTRFIYSNSLPFCLHRSYSTNSLDDKPVDYQGYPVKTLYVSVLEDKAKIIKDNKDKSGVYM